MLIAFGNEHLFCSPPIELSPSSQEGQLKRQQGFLVIKVEVEPPFPEKSCPQKLCSQKCLRCHSILLNFSNCEYDQNVNFMNFERLLYITGEKCA